MFTITLTLQVYKFTLLNSDVDDRCLYGDGRDLRTYFHPSRWPRSSKTSTNWFEYLIDRRSVDDWQTTLVSLTTMTIIVTTGITLANSSAFTSHGWVFTPTSSSLLPWLDWPALSMDFQLFCTLTFQRELFLFGQIRIQSLN